MDLSWVVVNHDACDGVDVHGPFSQEEAERHAVVAGGRPMRVVSAGVAFTEARFVAVEASSIGGIAIYGWFASREAAEAFCHRQSMTSPLGVEYAAVAVS